MKLSFGFSKSYLKFYLKIKFLNINKRKFSYSKVDLFDGKDNVFFIHIPKSAGMSCVNEIYGQNYSNHALAIDYIMQNEKLFKDGFSFSITREPLQRAKSAFYYLKNGGMNPIDKVWRDIFVKRYKNFEDFVIFGGLETAVKYNAQHFIPQHHYTHINNTQVVDYVGKLEDIRAVEIELSNRLGRQIKLPVKNKGVMSRGDVSLEVKRRVFNIYKKDYEIFYNS